MGAEYIVDKSSSTEVGDTVRFYSGGYAEYDFYLPFNAVSADITYKSGTDGTLTITTDEGVEKSVSLTAGEGTVTAEFDITERKGERRMRFTSDVQCEISKITVNKEKSHLFRTIFICVI